MPNLDPSAQVGLAALLENVAANGGLRLGRFGDSFGSCVGDLHAGATANSFSTLSANSSAPALALFLAGPGAQMSVAVGNWGTQISSESTFLADGERSLHDAAFSELLAELLVKSALGSLI